MSMTKYLSHLFLTLLIMGSQAWAGEMTGVGVRAEDVLEDNNIDPRELQNSGHIIVSGELTGIGKSIPLKKVNIFVLEKEVIYLKEVDAVLVGQQEIETEVIVRDRRYEGLKAAQVHALAVGRHTISKSSIKGLVYKKQPQ